MSDPTPSAAPQPWDAPEPRRGSLLVIFLTVFVDLLGFGMVLPLLPIYAKSFLGVTGPEDITLRTGLIIGGLMSCFSLMQFLFVPVWGRLSDRIGRRPVLIVGLAGSTLFYALIGVATAWQSLLGLFLARIGAGIAGATIATAQAYIADTTTKEKRNKGMALIGAAFAIGFTLGPSLGAVAILAGDNIALSPWPGYVAAMFSGMALLLAIFKLPESLRPGSHAAEQPLLDRQALRSALLTPSIGLLLLTSFVALFSFANFESTLAVQVEELVLHTLAHPEEPAPTLVRKLIAFAQSRGFENPEDVRLIVILAVFAYLGLVLTFAQGFLVRRLAGKVPEGTLALTGGLVAVAGFVLLGLAAQNANFNLLLIAMAVEVTGYSLVSPSLQSLISRRSDPEQQGGVLGIAQSSASLARIIGPLFGNMLFFARPPHSASWPYYGATALMILALVALVQAVRGGKDWPT